jgi:polyhydroxyalkanoate synthesis repressor PhaR
VIKRYGNRRLYDAKLSRCVTMAEIAEMVRLREDVRVVDGDNGEDLTKRVLVQIILEEQNASQLEVLPVELLHQIIAARSQPVASWLGQYLSAGAEFLERQSQAAAPALRGMTDSLGNLFPWLNPESWKNTPGAPDLSAFAQAAQQHHAAHAPRATTPDPGNLQQELADLQARFADLTARFTRT